MSIRSLMRHKASVWRQETTQDATSQAVTGFSLVYRCIPCFIQPANQALVEYYEQRGTTVSHMIYTSAMCNTFQREDVLLDARGNQYHLTAGPLNALESDVYIQLVAEQYPEGAKQRLDIGQYESSSSSSSV